MYYEIREVRSKSLQINLEDGKVEKPKYSEFSGKSFRVLKNGFWGYFVGDVRDEEGIERAKRLAVIEGDADVEDKPFSGKFIYKEKKPFDDLDLEDKVKILREIDYHLKNSTSRRVVYIESVKEVTIRNSSGGEVSFRVPRCGVIMQAFAKGKTLQFYSERVMRVGGLEVIESAYEKAGKVAEIAVKLSNADAPPSGRMNIVMNPSLTGVFIHEAFGHGVEADHVLQNATVLKDLRGKKVAADCVNVFDDPTIPEFGFFPFDDEGYKAERKVIIEEGYLKNFLNTRETAKKLGGNGGNARAENLEVPIPRMSNTFIDCGDYDLEELISEAKFGVMLFGSRGGETNPATGYFHFNAQFGYLIENGETTKMIRDVSMSGYTLEILRDIKLGKEIEFDPGFCGKSGQIVPVADGGPFALVKALVGGS